MESVFYALQFSKEGTNIKIAFRAFKLGSLVSTKDKNLSSHKISNIYRNPLHKVK